MSESNTVPDDSNELLLNEKSDVQTKVGHVAKFDSDENPNDLELNFVQDHSIISKKENQFIGLTKEELKSYINNPKWKRIRWIIGLIYILLIISLLIGSILLIIYSSRCPPKPKLVWYQKDIIYEIDVTTFYDTNQDAIGDIKGIEQKLDYFEKNSIKSILIRSSIFNFTIETSIKLDGQMIKNKTVDLLTIDPLIGNETEFDNLIKIFNRKDMHIILDLPLSSTSDPNGRFWYGSNKSLQRKINNPCNENPSDLGCQYYKFYGLLPLDFNNSIVSNEAESRINHWLSKKKIDGIRVNLPLIYNPSKRSYNISYQTINNWINIISNIEKKSKPKLFIIDIPFGLQKEILNDELNNKTAHPLLLLNNQEKINSELLDRRLKSIKPLFWQLGSKRQSDSIGIINQSKEMILTIIMLVGGTPFILYGEEIGLNQVKINPLMSWTSDSLSGGFSSCSSNECKTILSEYQIDSAKINVKREEALGGGSKDSLLTLFRYLAKLRQHQSFQFGSFKSGFHQNSNLFWFIREAAGHQGFIILLNLNNAEDEIVHLSLNELTNGSVPEHIHYEYQWPKAYLSTFNKTHINSDNLLIHSQSINIFSWKIRLHI